MARVASLHRLPLDRVGLLVTLIGVTSACLPFVQFRANRIMTGTPQWLWTALPGWASAFVILVGGAAALLALRAQLPPVMRLVAALATLLTLALALGLATHALTPDGDRISRTSPAAGFWLATLAFGLMATDAVVKARLRPRQRIGLLLAVLAGVALIFVSGLWQDVSVMREYANRSDTFWREAGTHLLLAVGSLGIAAVIGLPLGVAIHRTRRVRAGVVAALNAVQTIPSIALFGLLIAPLSWLAAAVPPLAALGVAGIGTAPALIALVLYSLMPMVANMLTGLDAVPASAVDAARGMGMTPREQLVLVELPLAFPSVLLAIRFALVQNIGLATVAALIGGGGLGVFVFQGVGQTAMDLVLLGAAPAVAMALSSAVLLDATIELSTPRSS